MSQAKIAAAGGLAAAILLATPLIAKWEGERRVGYADLIGTATSCFGHTKTAVVGRRYTEAECREQLRQDVAEHAAKLSPCVPRSAPVEVQAAFLSLGFNVGTHAVCTSKSGERLRAGDYRGACNGLLGFNKVRITGQWPKWCPPDRRSVLKDGRRYCRVQGLENRRADEHRLCMMGVK